MVDLANSYDIIEKPLDARTAPSNHAALAAPAASVIAGHANAIARDFVAYLIPCIDIRHAFLSRR